VFREPTQGQAALGGDRFTANGESYAVLTSIFNVEHFSISRGGIPRPHVGIDFRGSDGTDIVSFIHGRVIASGEMGASNFDHVLIIKPLYEDDIIYLLAHLASTGRAAEGSIVKPGQVIAQVGPTSFPHLHVSVLRTDKSEKEDIVSGPSNDYQWAASFVYYDPFDRSIPLKT